MVIVELGVAVPLIVVLFPLFLALVPVALPMRGVSLTVTWTVTSCSRGVVPGTVTTTVPVASPVFEVSGASFPPSAFGFHSNVVPSGYLSAFLMLSFADGVLSFATLYGLGIGVGTTHTFTSTSIGVAMPGIVTRTLQS